MALVLLPPLRNLLKVIVIVFALIMWLDSIGVRVTTLSAGLGVGSIAVAVAAQKSIETLISAITLYASKPVRVGNFLGTIEESGICATRVRTLDNTVVTVPNAEFMNLHLDNFTQRKKIWYHPKIRLRYETSPDQIRHILSEIKKLLVSHPKVLPDPARVRFTAFGDYSLDLDIFAYIDETGYGEYAGPDHVGHYHRHAGPESEVAGQVPPRAVGSLHRFTHRHDLLLRWTGISRRGTAV